MIKHSALVKISDDKIVVIRESATARFQATPRNIARLSKLDTGKARVFPTHTAIIIRASM